MVVSIVINVLIILIVLYIIKKMLLDMGIGLTAIIMFVALGGVVLYAGIDTVLDVIELITGG